MSVRWTKLPQSARMAANQSLPSQSLQKGRSGRGQSDTARLQRATDTVRSAYIDAWVEPERQLFVMEFDGARLATLNTLLGANPWSLQKYAKAWHHAVAQATFLVRPKPSFETAMIRVIRYTPSHPADPDNLIAKAPIDGLRHAGVLAEDTPEIVKEATTQQKKGSLKVRIEVRPG